MARPLSAVEKIEDLLQHIVSELVDDPDAVEIQVASTSTLCALEVRVGEGEAGKVIGKHGRLAQSIRDILIAIGRKNDVRINVGFLE